jgi:digeranylgeranylglycerophospholipid reductase
VPSSHRLANTGSGLRTAMRVRARRADVDAEPAARRRRPERCVTERAARSTKVGSAAERPHNLPVIDVAIVGGGPAGLLTASRLAQSGLEVVLFEEHPVVGEPAHCTGIVSLETAELAKLPEDLLLGRLTRARLIGPGGSEVRHLWRSEEAILAIDRAAFDANLARQAASAGAIMKLSTVVQDVEVAADEVTVRATGSSVRARACVLACGVSYRFQRRLGLGLPRQVVHTAQVEVDANPEDEVELYFGRTVAPGGFVWTVPVARERRPRLKIGAMAQGDAGACLTSFLRRPQLRERLRDETGPMIRRLLPLGPIVKTYAERLLIVGDAGGFTKPTTGGGIFYSLLTASLASETLLEAFGADRLDDTFLARYEQRWQERLGPELRTADWLRQLLTRCSDAEIDSLVRALAADDVQALVRRTARFNWHRDLILALGRHPRVMALLLRALFR